MAVDGPKPLSFRRKLALMFTRPVRGCGFWFNLAVTLLWPIFMFGTRVSFHGTEHIPRHGGVLLAANHIGDLDPLYDTAFVLAAGRVPRFLAKAELWSLPVVRWVMNGGGHIPVDRSARATDAFRAAVDAVKRGETVVIYPEGTFTSDPAGWPMKAKAGIGQLALLTDVPVIPIANWGTQDVLPPDTRRLRVFRRKRVTVVAGPPVDLSQWRGQARTRANNKAATAAVMAEVTRLVAEIRQQPPPSEPYDPDAAGGSATSAG